MSGNYVDTTETRTVNRPCACPGTPHEQDIATVRVRLGYGELAIFRQAGWVRSKGEVFSHEDAKAALLTLGVRGWNLALPDGTARPVDTKQISLLDEDAVE